jgi:glutaredoxin
MKIKMVGLSDCGKCKTLKTNLKQRDIDYEFSDCDKDPQNCDNLEALTGSTQYPMILIQDLEDNLLEIYYLTDNYHTMIAGSYNRNGIKLIPTHSTDSLLNYVSHRLNLKA